MTKIILLAANPKDTNELQLYQEIYEIDQAVRRARFGTQFNFEARPQVRLQDLSKLLAELKPDIVHFSGHGNASSEIILVDDDGNSRPVESEALKTIFAHLKGKIRCVVLNACYAESQADAISREIDCVVGMLGAIDDKAAISFAREFYRNLANGKDVGTAFELARAQIRNGQKLARLHSIKANPSHIVFVKERPWSKYIAIITIVPIVVSLFVFAILSFPFRTAEQPSYNEITDVSTPSSLITEQDLSVRPVYYYDIPRTYVLCRLESGGVNWQIDSLAFVEITNNSNTIVTIESFATASQHSSPDDRIRVWTQPRTIQTHATLYKWLDDADGQESARGYGAGFEMLEEKNYDFVGDENKFVMAFPFELAPTETKVLILNTYIIARSDQQISTDEFLQYLLSTSISEDYHLYVKNLEPWINVDVPFTMFSKIINPASEQNGNITRDLIEIPKC